MGKLPVLRMLRQMNRILEISDAEAGIKEEKLLCCCAVGWKDECGNEVEILLSRQIGSLEMKNMKLAKEGN